MTQANAFAELAGRAALASLFLVFGVLKIGAYEGMQGYMESHGVPGALLPLVIALEIGGAAALVFGLYTRWAALALAGFTAATAILFHGNLGDEAQFEHFLKNVALIGAFVFVWAHGPGRLSLDARRTKA